MRSSFAGRCNLPWLAILLVLCGTATTANASTQVRSQIAGFEEPLLPVGESSEAESAAVSSAAAHFSPLTAAGLGSFEPFLKQYPNSPWALSVNLNVGLSYYREGYFSKAIDAWERAWAAEKAAPSTTPNTRALADRAVGELIRMHARLGHHQRLAELLAEVEGRALVGSATEAVAGAKQGLWVMKNDPGIAYLCGPRALRSIATFSKAAQQSKTLEVLNGYRSGEYGVSLSELSRLSQHSGMKFRPAFRQSGLDIPVPSVVHWQVGHYAAVVETNGDRVHIQDPTFGHDLWITRSALNAESSGYFMVTGSLKPGWRDVTALEADSVRGMGYTNGPDPNGPRPDGTPMRPEPCPPPPWPPAPPNPFGGQSCPTPNPPPPCNHGMCGYNADDMEVSLTLSDTPVGYTPSIGPNVLVRLVYNQREGNQPAVPNFGNLGQKWTTNWLGYIVDSPTGPAGSNVFRYVRGGGGYSEYGYDSQTRTFTPERPDYSVLKLASTKPVKYVRYLKDGSQEVYSASDGAAVYPRRIFLSSVVDPAGNSVQLTYDQSLRLTTITDAVGRKTTLSYENSTFPLQVTKITDPFARLASIAYDRQGRLSSITDVLGLTSSFTYDSGTFVTAMKTPYGTSRFSYGESGPDRWLLLTDALGNTERLESKQSAPGIADTDPRGVPAGMNVSNSYLQYRNSFYWDALAYQRGAGDYTKARINHYYHDGINGSYTSFALEATKNPLEGWVWYNTPGVNGIYSGSYNLPSQIGRVLDDGSSQVTNIEYNDVGNVSKLVDPVGRTTTLSYASNGVDITQVQQSATGGRPQSIARLGYNRQHLPVRYVDASGGTTTYTYNAAGQLVAVQDALNRVTSYTYDSAGQLLTVTNPNGKISKSLSWDGFGRVASMTDSEGWTRLFTYDAMDRLLAITYPDGTSTQYSWDKLDLVQVIDRLGRATSHQYDAVRRLRSTTDPLGRSTQYAYYPNGKLRSLTDANGNVTTWARDIQSRLTAKQYADGSSGIMTWNTYGGRLAKSTDASGRTQTFSYAADGKIASVVYAGGGNNIPSSTVKFGYDATYPRLTSLSDDLGTSKFTYGKLRSPGALLLVSEKGPYANDEIQYTYDAAGRLISRAVGGDLETFTLDNLDRTTVTISVLGTEQFSYVGETNQALSKSIGPTINVSYGYESNLGDRRLKTIYNPGTARSFSYTTNSENTITQMTDTGPAGGGAQRSWNFGYDMGGRLISAAASDGQSFRYGYDSGDNIIQWALPSGTSVATYNSLNEIATKDSSAFRYDSGGNLLEDATRTYTWNAAGRLATIQYKNQPDQRTDFLYDGLGRRTVVRDSTASSSTEVHYRWCDHVHCQTRDAQDKVLLRIFPDGQFNFESGQSLYFARDHLGSVRDTISIQNGTTVAALDYDPYGTEIKAAGNTQASLFRFATMEQLSANSRGLYMNLYRDFDPGSGRWISREPIGEENSANLYQYAALNPINFIDKLGLQQVPAGSTGSTSTQPAGQSKSDAPPPDIPPNERPNIQYCIQCRAYEVNHPDWKLCEGCKNCGK